jgi:hypothetical protein
MRKRVGAVVASAVGTAIAILALAALGADVGLDVWNLPAYEDTLRRAEAKNQELDETASAVFARIWAKEAITEELLGGRCSLDEAAVRFRLEDEKLPGFDMNQFRAVYPGRDDDERYCVQVCTHARAWIEGGGQPRSAAALAVLHQDFERRFGCPVPDIQAPHEAVPHVLFRVSESKGD